LTDDQGYGDLSVHGNPYVKTPSMDALYEQSIRFTDFHVAPSCTPTRSALLTGIHAMHNGTYDPTGQQTLLDTSYTLLSDVFSRNGYKTALYGKWHLGGNSKYYRPHERGFDDAVHFLRGGLWSHPNYWNSDLVDDYYYHNGELKQYPGYANDVWFSLGKEFVLEAKRENQPFFLYLPVNSPHLPWIVPEKYREPYLDKGLDKRSINFYAMIAAADEQLGSFVRFLKQEEIWDNTIFVFMTDNGSTLRDQEYNAGMRGTKGSIYEGGHRVPCFVSYPNGNLGAPRDIDVLAQGQDLFPTFIDLCRLEQGKPAGLEGTSLAGLLRGEEQQEGDDRVLVVQAGGGLPKKHHASVMWKKWRLVEGSELYNLENDLAQQNDVSEDHPEIVRKLRDYYDTWWEKARVSGEPQPYFIGNEEVKLTAYDWIEEGNGQVYNWPHLRRGEMKNGRYLLVFEQGGRYQIALRRWPKEADVAIRAGVPAFDTFDPFADGEDDFMGPLPEGKAMDIRQARISVGDNLMSQAVREADKEVIFEADIEEGKTYFQTWFVDSQDSEFGAYYIYINQL
jgi:arylsulfatase A-like enzyme